MPERFIKVHNVHTGSEAMMEEISFHALWWKKGWVQGRLPEDWVDPTPEKDEETPPLIEEKKPAGKKVTSK